MATPLLPSELLAGLPQQWLIGLLLLLPVVLLVPSYLFLASPGTKMTKDGARRLPPGPAQVPVLGNLHLLGRLPHRNLRDLARRHGPVMLLQLGTVTTLVVSSAAAAREVMKEHDIDCCSRPASPGPRRLSYGFKDVAFAPYGEQWREARKLFIVELLSMRRVQAAWYAREQQVDRLIADLSRAGAEAAPVALKEHIFGLVDGIIGTVAFGNIYGTERFAHRERFQHVMDEAMDMMASFSTEDFFPNAAGRLVDRVTGLVARCERIFRELDAFFETVIDQHTDPARVVPENGGDLVDVLVSLWKENRGTIRFSRDHVKGLIMDTFIGGINTSSVTMLWAMSELIRKPRVLRKAQDEVRAVVGGKARVEPDDVPKLPYLKMVVKETLRLHPPATLLVPRETVRDVRIGGYDVPARTRVLGPGELGGRQGVPPDRFEGSDVDYNGAHFELVPFGAGRRICPGLAMGETNVTFTLANLLYCFDWALPEGMAAEDVSMEEAGGLTFHQKMPLVLVPTRYHHRTATA
uniref:4-hydroxyphenylacetaldehyde oxime monooxygenase n=1 Tax=Setaria italica TaxID=4555 RepID=K4AMG6_SETIT